MNTFTNLRNAYIELHVPENAARVEEASGLAIVYLYINAPGIRSSPAILFGPHGAMTKRTSISSALPA